MDNPVKELAYILNQCLITDLETVEESLAEVVVPLKVGVVWGKDPHMTSIHPHSEPGTKKPNR